MADRSQRGRGAIAALGLALTAALGYGAMAAGTLTCHEDVGSEDVAPRLCASVGNETVLFLPLAAGLVVVGLLFVAGARTRTLAVGTALIVAGDAALIALWALVSHGTIGY